MANKKEIYAFAVHWLEKYRNPDTTEREVIDGYDEACFALGFVMDCGESFEAEFPGKKAFQDAAVLEEVINQIQDIQLLGSAIFSKWRFVTYWTLSSLLEPEYRDWFMIAFSRLVMLTANDTLAMPDLFVFDGNCKPDKVDKITINYHRVTKIKRPLVNSNTLETFCWDYTEQLVIDRKTETLELTQHIGSGCVISHKYYVQEGVPSFLDELDSDRLFEDMTGNGPDVVTDPNETKDYEIIVEFDKRPQFVIRGTFDKNGLPEDWPELAEGIYGFICCYGLGEILAPSIYLKAKRKVGDYIVCSVEFDEGSKSYYYLAEDDTLAIGDLVLVPVGKDRHTAIVEIVKIEYFPVDKLPFPLNKIKRITRKCSDEDFVPQTKA